MPDISCPSCGEQRTPAGRRDAYDCYACGGKDVTFAKPAEG